MRGTLIVCDVCGTEKKKSNKWWSSINDDFGISLYTPDSTFATTMNLHKESEDRRDIYDLCGIGCALKWASQELPKIQRRFDLMLEANCAK